MITNRMLHFVRVMLSMCRGVGVLRHTIRNTIVRNMRNIITTAILNLHIRFRYRVLSRSRGIIINLTRSGINHRLAHLITFTII